MQQVFEQMHGMLPQATLLARADDCAVCYNVCAHFLGIIL